MAGTVFKCVDWFWELCRIFFASNNSSCLRDNSNTKQTLYSSHWCNKLCSKVWLRELWRKSCGFRHYLQLAESAKIDKDTTNLWSLTKKVAHICTDSGIPVNAFGGNGVRSNCLGVTGWRSTKGSHLVGSNNDTNDTNEKRSWCSIPVLSVCGNIGNGHTADHGNGAFNCRLGSKFKTDFHMGMCWERLQPCILKCFSNVC